MGPNATPTDYFDVGLLCLVLLACFSFVLILVLPGLVSGRIEPGLLPVNVFFVVLCAGMIVFLAVRARLSFLVWRRASSLTEFHGCQS